MPFHEKSAWIMLAALLLGGLLYFGSVVAMSMGMESLAPPTLPQVIVYTVILVLIAIAGHVVVAALAPREADARPDERERLILAQAGNRSSLVIGVGVLLSLGLYLVTYDGHLLFYGVFASLMLSQLAEYGLQIWYYRRGI